MRDSFPWDLPKDDCVNINAMGLRQVYGPFGLSASTRHQLITSVKNHPNRTC